MQGASEGPGEEVMSQGIVENYEFLREGNINIFAFFPLEGRISCDLQQLWDCCLTNPLDISTFRS